MTWRIKDIEVAEETPSITATIVEFDDGWKETGRKAVITGNNLVDIVNMAIPFGPDNLGMVPNVADEKKA